MRKGLILLILALAGSMYYAAAQDYSNKGKDFWVIYTGHIDATTSRMALYITSDQNATGTLSVNGSSLPFTVTTNQVTTLRLTNASTPNNSLAYNSQSAGIGTNKGIHIVTDVPVVVYSHILNSARSGATLVLPTNVLGREYYVSSYTSVGGNNSRSEFAIVATEDNTLVEIKPTLADVGNTHTANTPFQVTLNKGDVYQYQSNNSTDLTGSYIKSIASASAPCKPIAVYAGSTWTAMGCASANSGDNLYQEMFPLGSWGQTYITAPFALRSFDIFRIMVKDPLTVVQVNGVTLNPATLVNNAYYEINTSGNNTPRIITTNIPVCVVQYMITQNCDNVNADPEMVILNPIEQTLNDITVLSARNDLTPPNTNITRHFINVIIKTAGLGSLTIDGAPPVAAPIAIPSTPYSYIKEEVTTSTLTNPSHRIYADSGFVAIAYGYGNVESYGYNAGTNVRDLFQFITVQNPYATVPFPAACKSTPFYFSIVFPYQPTSIIWDFNGLFPAVTLTSPVYDSTWVVNGKQLYRYKLTTPYTINVTGAYPIKVTAQNPTPDGCGTAQEINYTLQVFNQPVADFTFNNACFPDPVQFLDNSITEGRPVISRYWDFGDITNSGANNPLHSYPSPGVYNVSYSLITDVGCLSDTTSRDVTVSPLPTGGISGSTMVCLNSNPLPRIMFTGVVGTVPFIFTYTLNGGPPQTITTTALFNSVYLDVPTNVAGTFTYVLTNVQDSSPGACSQPQSGTATVIVQDLPTATISGNVTVCKLAPLPVVTFTGGGGLAPYTFTYNINGGPDQVVSSTVGNQATIQIPTATPGAYTVNLISVVESSFTHCLNTNVASSVLVTVKSLPTATLSSGAVLCQNDPQPTLTFTGSGGIAPYTINYTLNGTPQTITTTGDQATITIPTNVTGLFSYVLSSVTESSPETCTGLPGAAAYFTIRELPVAQFSHSSLLCDGTTIQFTDASVPNAASLTAWHWNFGDPASGVDSVSLLQNPVHLFSGPGTYTVSLYVRNLNSCFSLVYTETITIHPKPEAGFILPDVCLNDTYAQFTDTSLVTAPDVISGWNWNFGDPVSGVNNVSVLQNPQHSYTATGSYPVHLDIVTNAGCRDTVNTPLYVNGSFPVSDFIVNAPATLCANDSVAITDAATVFPGNITKIEIYWDDTGQPTVFDTDDFPVPGRVYRHLYPNFQAPLTKTFNIRYRAYSGGVCMNEKVRTITVNAAPKVQFNAIPDICLDAAPVQLTQASEIGAVPGTGVYSGPGVNAAGLFNPATAGAGTHTIMYTFTSTAGGCADSLSQTIHVYAAAVPDFTIGSPRCETKAITFTQSSTSSEGTLTNWIWDFGDGTLPVNSVNGNPVAHTFAAWGPYTVKLKVRTSNGCFSPDKLIPITVHPQPHPDFRIPASACLPNANVSFTDLSTIADGTASAFTYFWDFGDPASGVVNNSTAMNPSHTYTSSVPWNVNLQVTSGDGCVDDTTIVLNTIHDQPIAAFGSDRPTVCVGEAFRFTDQTNQLGGSATQWNWDLGDGNTRTVSAFNYTYANPGTYTVSLFTFNNFGCRSNTKTSQVTVYPYPVVDAGPERLVLEGGQTVLLATATGNQLTYVWTPNLHFAGNNQILQPTVMGVDDIRYLLTVTAQGNCKDTSSVFVKVLKFPAVPNIFSPNGDGIHDTWLIEYLDTYPGSTVDIYNRYGQHIYHSNGYSIPWDGKINGQAVPVGTYYYIIDPKNGRKKMAGYVDVIR